MTEMNGQLTEALKRLKRDEAAKAAKATHQDYHNPNIFYRRNRLNGAIEQMTWNPETEMLSEWQYTGYGHIPDWAGRMK